MHVLEHMTIADGICRFRPQGTASLVDAVAMVTGAISHCRSRGVERLLADVTGLSGFSIPTLVDRYWMAQDWAHAAQGRLIVSIVALPEHIDPNRFGIKAAADAGLKGNVFTRVEDAVAWLLANAPDDVP